VLSPGVIKSAVWNYTIQHPDIYSCHAFVIRGNLAYLFHLSVAPYWCKKDTLINLLLSLLSISRIPSRGRSTPHCMRSCTHQPVSWNQLSDSCTVDDGFCDVSLTQRGGPVSPLLLPQRRVSTGPAPTPHTTTVLSHITLVRIKGTSVPGKKG